MTKGKHCKFRHPQNGGNKFSGKRAKDSKTASINEAIGRFAIEAMLTSASGKKRKVLQLEDSSGSGSSEVSEVYDMGSEDEVITPKPTKRAKKGTADQEKASEFLKKYRQFIILDGEGWRGSGSSSPVVNWPAQL